MATEIKKCMMLPGILGMILALGLSPIAQTAEYLGVEEIWTCKTDTVLSISVSEEGNLAFSEQTRNVGFIRIYNQEDKSLESWKCSSTERVVVSGNYVFAAYNGNIFSLFQIKPSKQLWGRRIDLLSLFCLGYSHEVECAVVGDIPMDSALNPVASTIWVFDQNGGVIWEERLNVHLTCAVINQKGYVVAAGEKFGPLDKNFNYTEGENAVYAFDPSGKLLAHVQFDSPPIDVGIDKNAERIVVGLDNGGMVLLNRDGKVLWEKGNIGGYVALDEQGKRIVTTKLTHLVLLNQEGKVLWESQQEVTGGIEGLVVSPNGKYIGIQAPNLTVVILEAASGKVLYQIKPGKKVSRVSLSNCYAGIAIKGKVKLLRLK
jgi:hypothetical protein